MAEGQIRGKSVVSVAKDIAEGFMVLNPLVLKRFEKEMYKALHQQLKKVQREVRSESFPTHDTMGIRKRNTRLQRLHTALVVLEHAAKEKRIPLM
ncbi:MAG: hypothetical protein MPW14_12155 [Candidatus Manganitrophus sp.]|nr:hypothetical protein [Candidatus Manganitrophus sp.]MDC4224768.1 hypothetical protein [Candidatus Manganitrophus sp.]WDT70358.1 MAG: hypothetical protein MPW17_16580 [Candidatus Manganitrophus sp.]WDT82412.1 MAG: hypothetical protein MPW14_12155 [Candidatus Manganitrophus sp.]